MDTTSWNMIEAAGNGDSAARERFAQTYDPLIRRYLDSRWRGAMQQAQLDDAVQEVFIECFRSDGVLQRADADRPAGFRAFLAGVVRNVAMRWEKLALKEQARRTSQIFEPDAMHLSQTSMSRNFDRTWAKMLLRDAVERMAQEAEGRDADARRRVELLRLRFHDGLAVKDVARMWDADVILLNRQHTKALREFKRALSALLVERHPQAAARIETELAEITRLLRS